MRLYVSNSNPLQNFRFQTILISTVITLVILFLLSVAREAAIIASNAPADSRQLAPANEDANVVTGGLSAMLYDLGQSAKDFGNATGEALRSVTSDVVATGGSFAGTVYDGLSAAGRGVASGVAYTVRLPGNIADSATDSPLISAIIKPANDDFVPVIGMASPGQAAATLAPITGAPGQTAAGTPPIAAEPAWPMHGQITTFFGVPHWPFQPTHTGIDISDGRAPGSTPIKPYRPGRVVDTIHSYSGLGNHVIIDHGGGVTSVYAHLASISVKPGQDVDNSTILGMEGSTGASTGTHLHFEIRINGKPVDPRQHISAPL